MTFKTVTKTRMGGGTMTGISIARYRGDRLVFQLSPQATAALRITKGDKLVVQEGVGSDFGAYRIARANGHDAAGATWQASPVGKTANRLRVQISKKGPNIASTPCDYKACADGSVVVMLPKAAL